MKSMNVVLLILLSAIWGGSFIFMRILAPVFGATGTADLRLLIAAIFLLIFFHFTRYKINWKRDWKLLLVIGIINSAIPFTCFSYAALHIPASVSVVINAMTPMFGALFSVLILHVKLSKTKIAGLIIGAIGVVVISGSKSLSGSMESYLAIAACLLATFCYGLSGVLIKKYGQEVEAKAFAGGSQLFAGLALFPFLLTTEISKPITLNIAITVVVFAVFCSAIAYLIYYHLIKEMGPTPALSVTFLMPVFGIFWGWLILGESIQAQMMIGATIILIGTYLVVKRQRRQGDGESVAKS